MKKIFLGSLLIILTLLWAQESDPGRFRLINADRLHMVNLESGQVLQLNGRVHFFYGEIEFRSDRAVILDGPKIARLSGNVVVENDSLHLVADSLAYYRNTQVLNLGGKVRATQRTSQGFGRRMEGDHGIYDRARDTITIWQNVRAWDERENAHAECGYGFWDRANGYAYLIEEPRIRAGLQDTLYINADKMEFFEEERKLIATFNVETRTQDYHASSDFLIYFANEERAVFTGEPDFYNDFATATAREFHLYFEEQKLSRVVLVDSCQVYFAAEEQDEKKNWVQAANIELNFVDGKLQDFSADLDVSYFFEQDQDGSKDFFINSASGERLKAIFDDDNQLKLMDMGGSIRGSYFFENQP